MRKLILKLILHRRSEKAEQLSYRCLWTKTEITEVKIAKTGNENSSQKRDMLPYGTGKGLKKDNKKTIIFISEPTTTKI